MIVTKGTNMAYEVDFYKLGWVVKKLYRFFYSLNAFYSLNFIERKSLSNRCKEFAHKNLQWKNIKKNFRKGLLNF